MILGVGCAAARALGPHSRIAKARGSWIARACIDVWQARFELATGSPWFVV